MTLHCSFKDRQFSRELSTNGMVFEVQAYESDCEFGPLSAQIAVFGDQVAIAQLGDWLRCEVSIWDDESGKTWNGYISQISLQIGPWSIGLTLDEMANTIKVVYNLPSIYGASDKLETSWASDSESLALYGRKEYVVTMADITTEQAEAARAIELGRRAIALADIDLGNEGIQATLQCRGWADTLTWMAYSQPAGLEQHNVSGNSTQALGLGMSTPLGFDKDRKAIHDIQGRLAGFKKDYKLQIVGGTNAGTYTVDQGTSRELFTLTASTISFSSGDKKINDSAKGLKPINAGDMIQVAGSVANNGYYLVKSGAADGSWIELTTAITNGAAGPAVTLTRGNSIIVKEDLAATALPGSAVGIQVYGEAIRQRFIPSSGTWTVGALAIRLRKVGNPVDGVRIALYNESGGNPGTELDGLTLSSAAIPASMEWVTAEITNTVSVTAGIAYQIVVNRTGANDISNYYEVSVDEGLTYANGAMRLKVNGVWDLSYLRTPDADLPFKVIGYKKASSQIIDIIASCGQFLEGVDVQTTSDIAVPQYRDGSKTALDELRDLLKATTTNRRMLASISSERWLTLTDEPAKPSPTQPSPYCYGTDGVLRDVLGRVIPYTTAVCGVWCDIDVLPVSMSGLSLAAITPVFIEAMTINPTNGTQKPRFRGARAQFDL